MDRTPTFPIMSFERLQADDENEFLIPKKSDRFKVIGYKDKWAAIAWLLSLTAFVSTAAFTFNELRANPRSKPREFPIPLKHVAGILSTALVVSFGLSFSYFLTMKRQVIITD